MLAVLVLSAMYGSAFLPLLVLTLARVGKAEIWVLTGLSLLWLAFMAWLHVQLFETTLPNPALPWAIAGACGAVCVLWAIVLSLLKKTPAPSRGSGAAIIVRR